MMTFEPKNCRHENHRRHRLHPDPVSLGVALFFLMRDKGKSNKHRAGAGDARGPVDHPVPAAAGAYKMGWIAPTGIR
jgi:hypothetical protein